MDFEALSDIPCIFKCFLRFSRSLLEENSSELIGVSCPVDPVVILGILEVVLDFLCTSLKSGCAKIDFARVELLRSYPFFLQSLVY